MKYAQKGLSIYEDSSLTERSIEKMKEIEKLLNMDDLTQSYAALKEKRQYDDLVKCLDSEGGVTESNISERFNLCWDRFKKDRQGYFEAF